MYLYRRLVESSPDGIIVVEDGRIAYANRAAADLFGVGEPDRLLGDPLFSYLDADSRASVRAQLLSWQDGLPTLLLDVKVVQPDGHIRDVSMTGAPAYEGGGSAQVILRDITERKAAERALRESEERLALAVAGGQEGVWDWNLETNAVVYSARWKDMLGYSVDEIEPHVSAWERLVHSDDRSRADQAHESVARGERVTYEAEFRLRHKDGHYVHVLSRGFPVRREPGGPVVRIVGTHLDLTEQKRADGALRENEERLKLAFAGAQEGVWDWNLETGAVVYSSRWKEMLGYADEEIEPHVSAWERLLHPDDVERAHEVNESVKRGAATYEGEFRLRHKDGHYVHVLSRGYPVRRDPAGPVVRIVGTHFDLTARKRAEAERARTELLTRLVFAQEDERRRIGREMHDQFGEQLTALAVRIRTLKEACGNHDEWRAHVESIEDIARQLDRDVDHLVWELRPTALDDLGLRAALANYVENWSSRVGVSATLHTSGLLDDRLPSDAETALYRIAQEALTNVAKHARAANVDVILERRADSVLLIIEDDGVGFDPAASAGAGQGFGLVGMQERAGLVGAMLEIESSAGKGTTVFVRMDAGARAGFPDHA
ncbi:MAG TPA: PAS domain-containing protein [Vicinamibacterales bacterium]